MFPEAQAAYGRATELRPDDMDGHLQLGRTLRLAGQDAEAVEALRIALELQASPEAYRELVALGEADLAEDLMEAWGGDAAASITLYDVTDLLGYLKAHQTLSGIQRVQANVIEQVLALPVAQVGRHRFVVSTNLSMGPGLLALPSDALTRMIRYATGPVVEHARLRTLIETLESLAVPLTPKAGQTFLILGAFWGLRQVIENGRRLKGEGLRVGVYIYDLIPITHPEFCDWALAFHFGMALGDALLAFDFILTISEHVAVEVRSLLGRAGLSHIPVEAVTLAHVLKPVKARRRGRADAALDRWTPGIAALKNVPYVLTVSTIEARKNHAYLFRAWREMLAAGEQVPDLVFVGRPGWRVDDLMAQLRDTGHLDGRLHILHDLTDDELGTLYRNCLFTAFPSFVEGWGLPVGESLAYGAPCVASSTSSIPEVGGDLVDYIDPLNLREGLVTLRRMLFEPGYRERRRQDIAERFQPRGWEDVTRDLLAAVARLAQNIPASAAQALPTFPTGVVFLPGDLSPRLGHGLPDGYLTCPTRAILAGGWYDCEDFGVWMRGEEGRLAFRADVPEGEEAVIYVQVIGAPQASGHILTIDSTTTRRRKTASGKEQEVRQFPVWANTRTMVRLRAKVGAEGRVALHLTLDRSATSAGPDHRRFAVGLVGLAWAPAADAVSRQEIMEILLLDQAAA
ncbi:glycosyltransferase family 4 protein [Roseomonas sp. OT10]|nr:glycosyltransferase family 4 protein [Roseomonas sp. OT10]